MLTLTSSSKIALIGDSVSAQFSLSIPWTTGWGPLLRAKFQPTVALGTPRAVPSVYVDAVAGRKTGDISGSIATTLLGFPKTITHIVFQLGINDAIAIQNVTLTLVQFQTNATTLYNAAVAQVGAANVGWAGPWANNGSTTTQIAQVDGALTTIVGGGGSTYITWSGVPFGGGNSQADGEHPTAQGAVALATQFMLSVA